MVPLIVLLILVISIITSFFSLIWAWLLILILDLFLIVTYLSLRNQKPNYIFELSPLANDMYRKFYHYYKYHCAGDSYSSSASGVLLGRSIVAVVSAFKGFWIGLLFGLINYVIMAFVARQFNPSNFLVDETEERTHTEILQHFSNQNNKMGE